MDSEAKKRVQVVLLVAMVLAGLRVAYIFYERRNDAEQAAQQEKQSQLRKDTLPDADYYVSLRKIHAYDLASARELTKAAAWGVWGTVRRTSRSILLPSTPILRARQACCCRCRRCRSQM